MWLFVGDPAVSEVMHYMYWDFFEGDPAFSEVMHYKLWDYSGDL